MTPKRGQLTNMDLFEQAEQAKKGRSERVEGMMIPPSKRSFCETTQCSHGRRDGAPTVKKVPTYSNFPQPPKSYFQYNHGRRCRRRHPITGDTPYSVYNHHCPKLRYNHQRRKLRRNGSETDIGGEATII